MTQILSASIREQITYRLVSESRLQETLGVVHPSAVLGIFPPGDAEFAKQSIREFKGQGELKEPLQRQQLDVNDIFDSSHITEHVRYAPAEGYRFSRPAQSVWYCGFPSETSVGEVAYHRWEALKEQGVSEASVEYYELIAVVSGTFCDLRPEVDRATPPELHQDSGLAYSLGQELADRVRQAKLDGIIFESVRCPPGTCIALFNLDLIRPVRLGARWTISWRGGPKYTAERKQELPSWLSPIP